MAERILVVEDEEAIREYMAFRLEEAGYGVYRADSAETASTALRENSFDLVLSDVSMPGRDGLSLLEEIRRDYPDLNVILVTALRQSNIVLQALKKGAYDYLVKPFRGEAMLASVERALENTRLLRENRRYQEHLEAMVQARTEQVEQLFLRSIEALVLALEAKDSYTEGHSRRVMAWAVEIGRALELAEEELEALRIAAMLHDIGKIGVSEALLNKTGRLTADEYAHIMRHPVIGARILEPIDLLSDSIDGVRHHHERWDGGGQPDGLAGEAIPLQARILAVADTFDAMTSDRPYRRALTVEEAMAEIERCSGRQFDPAVVEAFMRAIEGRHQNTISPRGEGGDEG